MNALIRIALLALLISLHGCSSGEGGDPLTPSSPRPAYGGTLDEHAGMPNAPPDGSNLYPMMTEVFEQLYQSYLDMFEQAGETEQIQTIRLQGNYSGYAMVQAQPVQFIQTPGSNIQFNAVATYYDYSSNGKLFLGGRIDYQGRWNDTDSTIVPFRIYLDGGVVFAGNYAAALRFNDFLLGINRDGALTTLGIPPTEIALGGEVYLVVAGDSTLIEPYPQD